MAEWLLLPMIIGMFILRFGVPLAITLAVGHWLCRLDARWQAEVKARRREAGLTREKVII